jgi:hypothetical protein
MYLARVVVSNLGRRYRDNVWAVCIGGEIRSVLWDAMLNRADIRDEDIRFFFPAPHKVNKKNSITIAVSFPFGKEGFKAEFSDNNIIAECIYCAFEIATDEGMFTDKRQVLVNVTSPDAKTGFASR